MVPDLTGLPFSGGEDGLVVWEDNGGKWGSELRVAKLYQEGS